MASAVNKVEKNVPGKYYVDKNCINCPKCTRIAPGSFTKFMPGRYSYVYKQPINPMETMACERALQMCPVKAIHNNGK